MMPVRASDSFRAFRTLLDALKRTPFHPQWFSFFREERFLTESCADLTGVVLDIGCADARPRRYLPEDATYIGIDHYSTATDWYGTRPDLFADALALPLKDNSIDHALLLDVMEHLPHPDRCLDELHRTLRPDGSLTIQVPFFVPDSRRAARLSPVDPARTGNRCEQARFSDRFRKGDWPSDRNGNPEFQHSDE